MDNLKELVISLNGQEAKDLASVLNEFGDMQDQLGIGEESSRMELINKVLSILPRYVKPERHMTKEAYNSLNDDIPF